MALSVSLEIVYSSSDATATAAASSSSPPEKQTTNEQQHASVEKIQASNGGIRLLVSMHQSKLVDAEQANLVAALLFEQIDQLTTAIKGTTQAILVERVKVSGVWFTPEGGHAMKEFFSSYAETVKQVAFKSVLPKVTSPQDETTFDALARAFQHSGLEILNLSDNEIGAYMWKNWANQTGLRQLLLDHVVMDDASIKELANHFTYARSLEELHVTLKGNSIGPFTVGDACTILENCTNLSSLRWANRTPDSDSKLPLLGLRQMVSAQLVSGGGVAALKSLALDGSMLTVSELGSAGLSGALKELTQLETLKVRNIGLGVGGVMNVTGALHISQPPLKVLDLSDNHISGGGAIAVAHLTKVERVVANLKTLVLDGNEIDSDGCSTILEAFASKIASEDFEIRLEKNPINFNKVCMRLARGKSQAEEKRDELAKGQREESAQSKDNQQKLRAMTDGKMAALAQVKELESEIASLKQEREVLTKAFRMVGADNKVDEHAHLLQKVSQLEDMVRSSLPTLSNKPNNNSGPSGRALRRPSRPGAGSMSSMMDSCSIDSMATPPDVSTSNTSGSRVSPILSRPAENINKSNNTEALTNFRNALVQSNAVRIKYVPSPEPKSPRIPATITPEIPNSINCSSPTKVLRGRLRPASSQDRPTYPGSPVKIVSPPPMRPHQIRKINSFRLRRATSERWGKSREDSLLNHQPLMNDESTFGE